MISAMFMKFVGSKISGYVAVGLIGLVAVLVAALWISQLRLGNAQDKVGELRTELAQAKAETGNIRDAAKRVNAQNLETIAACQAVNAENAAQRDQAQVKADSAVARAKDFERKLKTTETRYETLSAQLRALDDALPADLTDWLCGPSVNCIDGSRTDNTGTGSDRTRAARVGRTGAGTAVTTRRLANVYRQTVESLMVCNDRLLLISELTD